MIGFFQSAKNERSSKRLAFLVGVIILFILIVFAFIFGIKEPANIYNNCSLPKNYDFILDLLWSFSLVVLALGGFVTSEVFKKNK